MRGLILGFMLLGLMFAGCVEQPETPEPETQIPNPAAENCEEKGYDYQIRTGTAGSYGVCKYNGQECDEWDLYRGDCCLTDEDCHCEGASTNKCEKQKCSCTPILEPENETEPEPEPEPEEEPEEEPAPEYSDKTVGEFLDEGLTKMNSEFWKEHPSGDYTVETYTWVIGTVDIRPNEIAVGGTYLDSAVRFNGDKDPNIKGFGFKAYVPKDGGLTEAKAIGVFTSQFPFIHIYESNMMKIKIDFYPFSKTLYGCEITGKDEYLAGDGSYISNYYFDCQDMGTLTT